MPLRHTLLAVSVAVLWGLNFLAIHASLEHFPPIFLVALRFVVLAVPTILLVPRPQVPLRWLVGYGLGFGTLQFFGLYLGMAAGFPAGLASLVLQASAPFTVVLGVLLLRERLTPRRALGVGVAVAGLALVGLSRAEATSWGPFLLVVLGVALLVGGATLLVEGAVNIATTLGVSSLVVGLTVVAVGTALPELATAIIAVRRGERDLAVGNVVGSNIFNIGVVLGLPALISLEGIPVASAAVAFDMPVMLAAALALLPVAFTGFAVARWEGALFVALYLAYTGYVVLAATEHDALEGFTATMAWFVLPLIAVTLLAFTSYEIGLRKGRQRRVGTTNSP